MSQESGFFDWIDCRIRKLISENKPDFNGDVFTWNDYKFVSSNNYCVYQTEDLHLRHKLNVDYKKFLDGAKHVFDFSSQNLLIYPRAIHLPIKLEKIPQKNIITKNEIVFYGYITDRRKKFLNQIEGNKIPIKITGGQYGKNLNTLLAQHNFVLSIGSYDNLTNNSFRIIPAIENGCIVLAEKSTENWFNEYLFKECPDRIIFFNENTMIETIKAAISGELQNVVPKNKI